MSEEKKSSAAPSGIALGGVGAVARAGEIGISGKVALQGVGAVAVAGDFVVVHTIREAISAIRETRSEIVVAPEAWPIWFWQNIIIPAIVLFYIMFNWLWSPNITRRVISSGYNIERCEQLDISKTLHFSDCLKLTKPKEEDAAHPR
jgi:hypothetical protein